jgi:hypothetical protein
MTKVGAGELQLGPNITNTTWTAIVVSNGLLHIRGPVTNLSAGPTAPVTVASGATLRVTATPGGYNGTVTIQAGGKLEGTGIINGTVNVDGDLAPGVGTTTPGILTINNSLTLTSGSSTTVQVAAAAGDQVAGLTSVTFAGTLNVTEISASPITSGQTFQLFTIGGSGNFSSIVGTPSIGGTWSFNPATGILTHVP